MSTHEFIEEKIRVKTKQLLRDSINDVRDILSYDRTLRDAPGELLGLARDLFADRLREHRDYLRVIRSHLPNLAKLGIEDELVQLDDLAAYGFDKNKTPYTNIYEPYVKLNTVLADACNNTLHEGTGFSSWIRVAFYALLCAKFANEGQVLRLETNIAVEVNATPKEES